MFTEVIIALVAVALVQAFVVKPFGVPSQSMEQTLHIGDRILVNRLDDDITRGDVVVFGHGNTWQEKELPPASNVVTRALRAFGDLTGIGPSSTAYTVKRVIGLPGQKVACCSTDGKVTVDGQPLDEPYIYEDLPFTPGHARLLQLTALAPLLPGDHRAAREPDRARRPPLASRPTRSSGAAAPPRGRSVPGSCRRNASSGPSCSGSGRWATSAPSRTDRAQAQAGGVRRQTCRGRLPSTVLACLLDPAWVSEAISTAGLTRDW